jgi:hypothetical protein
LRSNITTAGAISRHAGPFWLNNADGAACGRELVLTDEGANCSLADPDAFARGFERFLDDDRFDEFNRIDHIRGQSGGAKRYMNCPSFRKEAICNSMACWPQGRWISFDEAFLFLLASRNAFDVMTRRFECT